MLVHHLPELWMLDKIFKVRFFSVMCFHELPEGVERRHVRQDGNSANAACNKTGQ